MLYFVILIISYFLGSIPFGLLITKIMRKGDLRKVGSGNIGATNVMRVGGLQLAFLTWILDMLKAVIAVWLGAHYVGSSFAAICGLVAILGHCFPLWLHFKGGKGVSSLFGVLLMTNPILFIVCGVEWLLIALGTGYSSAGALVTFVLMPVLGFCISKEIGLLLMIISLLCIYRHKENIFRLFNGKETKIEWKWKK